MRCAELVDRRSGTRRAISAGERRPGANSDGWILLPSPITRDTAIASPERAPQPEHRSGRDAGDGRRQHHAADHLPARRSERLGSLGQLAWDGEEQVATERRDDRDHHHGQDQPGGEHAEPGGLRGAEDRQEAEGGVQPRLDVRWTNGASTITPQKPERSRSGSPRASPPAVPRSRGRSAAPASPGRSRSRSRAAWRAPARSSALTSRPEQHRRGAEVAEVRLPMPGSRGSAGRSGRSTGAHRRSPDRRSRQARTRLAVRRARTARVVPWQPARSTNAVRLSRARSREADAVLRPHGAAA